jgi:hypothetical protein
MLMVFRCSAWMGRPVGDCVGVGTGALRGNSVGSVGKFATIGLELDLAEDFGARSEGCCKIAVLDRAQPLGRGPPAETVNR